MSEARRVTVKLGTGLLTDPRNRLNRQRIEGLVAQLAHLHEQKYQVILVSSGAIGAGMAELGHTKRPKRLPELQATAAVGQSKLMAMYDEIFGKFGIHVAQLLLTHDDLKNRTRHLNARNTLETLLRQGVLPIINENDTVAVDEIRFGDNDRLATLVAILMKADLLVILSHVDGLSQHDPALRGRAQVISTVERITADIQQLALGTQRNTSVGGMRSKVDAAKILTRVGTPMIIANGASDNVLLDLLAGQEIGTLFLPRTPKMASRKRWIAFFQRPAGTLVVDLGAKEALCKNAKSLLAKGILSTEGRFEPGDVVSIRDENEVEFARGLTKVNSNTVKAGTSVVVHRDDLVIL